MIRSKKRKDAWEEAALEKIRLLDHQLRRTQDLAVQLENVAAKYRDENKQLRDLVESLRWRIYTLLRSTNVDAEIFGMPKYRIDPDREYDDEETAEAFFEELGRLSEKYHVETEVVDDGGLKKNYLKEAAEQFTEKEPSVADQCIKKALAMAGLTGKEDIKEVSPEQFGAALAHMTIQQINRDMLAKHVAENLAGEEDVGL